MKERLIGIVIKSKQTDQIIDIFTEELKAQDHIRIELDINKIPLEIIKDNHFDILVKIHYDSNVKVSKTYPLTINTNTDITKGKILMCFSINTYNQSSPTKVDYKDIASFRDLLKKNYESLG